MGQAMSEKKLYIVTERAGEWVAGQRRPADGRLMLTAGQAAYELALGTIEPLPPVEVEKPRRRGRKARG